MKVVIIEDEELAARRLEGMIRDCDSSVEVIAKLESVEDSVTWFRNHPSPDLIFLDIHLHLLLKNHHVMSNRGFFYRVQYNRYS